MQAIAEMAARIAALEARVANMMRPGRVAEVDTSRQRVRLKLSHDDEGGDYLSPWLPYAQVAGQTRAHIPPSVGQQMLLTSPGGDPSLGVAMPATWHEEIETPSQAEDQNVITLGGVTITMTADGLTVAVGGVTVLISGDGLAVEGGQVTHNDVNIGDDHKHIEVVKGPAVSGPPEP